MTKTSIALALGAVLSSAISLSACDRISNKTVEEHIQIAKDFSSKGDRASALIELKNAVEKDPGSAQARLMLGQIYFEMSNGASAEKELTRARDLGVADATVAILLAKSLLLQGKHQEALAKLSSVAGLNASGMADLHTTRGKCFVGLGKEQEADEAFQLALKSDPNSAAAWEGQALRAYFKQQWDQASEWNDKILVKDPNAASAQALKGDIALAKGDATTAEAAYAAASRLRPENALYRTGLGIAHVHNGKHTEAKSQLDSVLKAFPHDPTANYYRAAAAYQLKDYEGAKTHAEAAVNSSVQEDLRFRMLASGANYALGQLESAHKHIQVVLASAPAYEPAKLLQAAIRYRMGQPAEAAASLKAVSKFSENDLKLINAVGMAAIKQGRSDMGLDLLQRAAQAHPDDPVAKIRLGIARTSKGDYEAAIDEFEAARKLNPKLVGTEAFVALNHLRARRADEALAAAERLQQAAPNHPDGYTLAGLAQLAKKQPTLARPLFSKALTIQPGNPNASQNLAALALTEGNRQEALRLLQTAAQKNPDHVSTLLKLTDLYLVSGQVQPAEKILRDALSRRPDWAPIRLAMGNLYLFQRKPDAALELADKALSNQPADPGLLELKGISHLQLGQPSLAISSFQAALKVASNSANLRFHLARAYEELGNLSLASAELQAVLKVAPKHVPAKFAQARVLAKSGKIDAAQKQLAELASAYPAAPSIPEVQGDLALAQNHSNEATAYYRTALGKGETNFLVSKLAASQLRSGDRMGGLTTLRSWLTRYPNDDYVRGSLADALLGMGQSAEAGEHYAKLLQRQPKNVSAANNLAWISLETGALQKAVAYAQQAYKLAPKRPEVLDTYGMVLLKQGLARDAVERLREAQSLARGNTAISLHYAEALIADKKRPEARKLLREVLDDMKTPPLNRQKAQALLNSL